MFKFKDIDNADRLAIIEAKGQSPSGGMESNFKAVDDQSSFAMPHESYMVGLSSLLDEEVPETQNTGLRVIDVNKFKFNSIFDLYKQEGKQIQAQVMSNPVYVNQYEKAFQKLFSGSLENEGFEVRSLQIPALNLEAIWLHRAYSPDQDLYIPVLATGLLKQDATYEKANFFSILRKAASKYDPSDGTIGG